MSRPALHMTKAETARWLGYGDDVAAMDAEHDPMHHALTAWLGLPSLSMLDAGGAELTPRQRALADIEEDAVLAVQRLRQHSRAVSEET